MKPPASGVSITALNWMNAALLSHEINGNSTDRLKKTQTAMNNYLIDGIYKEDDWK